MRRNARVSSDVLLLGNKYDVSMSILKSGVSGVSHYPPDVTDIDTKDFNHIYSSSKLFEARKENSKITEQQQQFYESNLVNTVICDEKFDINTKDVNTTTNYVPFGKTIADQNTDHARANSDLNDVKVYNLKDLKGLTRRDVANLLTENGNQFVEHNNVFYINEDCNYISDSSYDSDASYNHGYIASTSEDDCNSNSSEDKTMFEAEFNPNTISLVDLISSNNLKFNIHGMGKGKEFISGASGYPPQPAEHIKRSTCYPPQLTPRITAGAYDEQTNTCTNRYIDSNHRLVNDLLMDVSYKEINGLQERYCKTIIGDTSINLWQTHDSKEKSRNLCLVKALANLKLSPYEIEHVVADDNTILIENTGKRWYVNIPIRISNGKVYKVPVFADPGANAGCVNTQWAYDNFRDKIRKNTRNSTLYTPSGSLVPDYVLWLTFPSVTGKILKARMYLMNKLPVQILADINMLEAFGYTFKDGTPPFFQHPPEDDIDLGLKEDETQFKINFPTAKYKVDLCEDYKKEKINVMMAINDDVDITEIPSMHQRLVGGKTELYNKIVGSLVPGESRLTQEEKR